MSKQPVQTKQPDLTWSIEALLKKARAEMAEATTLAKRTTVHYYRAGRVLVLLREKQKKTRTWCKFQEEQGLSKSTVHACCRIFEGAKNEEEVSDMPIMHAFEIFGVSKVSTQAKKEREAARGAGPGEQEHEPVISSVVEDDPQPLAVVNRAVVLLLALQPDSIDWEKEDLAEWKARLIEAKKAIIELLGEISSQ